MFGVVWGVVSARLCVPMIIFIARAHGAALRAAHTALMVGRVNDRVVLFPYLHQNGAVKRTVRTVNDDQRKLERRPRTEGQRHGDQQPREAVVLHRVLRIWGWGGVGWGVARLGVSVEKQRRGDAAALSTWSCGSSVSKAMT